MSFIKVNAYPCNPQGLTSGLQIAVELYLNVDLIAAIQGSTVHPKVGQVIQIGGSYYKGLTLVQGANIPTA